MRGIHDILKGTAGAARNDPLIDTESPVDNFLLQTKVDILVRKEFFCRPFDLVENVGQILVDFVNRVDIARMERHSDHRTNCSEVDNHSPLIISSDSRAQFLIRLGALMCYKEFLCLYIGRPNGRKTCCLSCHNINATAEIH